MAAKYSQYLAWRRILQVLLLLFASVALSREFVQDNELNDLQALHSPAPAVKVNPLAPTPENEDYVAYWDAVSKGKRRFLGKSRLETCADTSAVGAQVTVTST